MRVVEDAYALTPDTSLVSLGIESLAAANLRQRIQTKLGCAVPLHTLSRWSVAFLADYLAETLSGGAAPAPLMPPSSGGAALTARGVAATSHTNMMRSPTPARALRGDGSFPMSALQRSYMVGREQGHGAWLYWETEVGRPCAAPPPSPPPSLDHHHCTLYQRAQRLLASSPTHQL